MKTSLCFLASVDLGPRHRRIKVGLLFGLSGDAVAVMLHTRRFLSAFTGASSAPHFLRPPWKKTNPLYLAFPQNRLNAPFRAWLLADRSALAATFMGLGLVILTILFGKAGVYS